MTKSTKYSQQQTFRDIVAIFFFEKNIFFATFLSIVATAILTSFLFPPIYEVNARLLVKPQNSKPLTFGKSEARYEVSNRVDPQFVNTVLELLKSRPVLEKVILQEQPELKDNKEQLRKEISTLKSSIKVKSLSLSHLIGVSMRGGDPTLITNRLNLLLKTYISYHINVNQTTQGRLNFFDTQTNTFKIRYKELTNELATKSQNMNVVSPDLQKESNLSLLKDLEIKRTESIGELRGLSEKLKQLDNAIQKNDKGDELTGLSADIIVNYPGLEEMERTFAQLVIDRERARRDYVATSKPVKDAEQQFLNMKHQVRSRMGNIVQATQLKIEGLKLAINALDQQIETTLLENAVLAANSIRLDALKVEHDMAKENFVLYSSQQEEARINKAKDQALFANVRITSPATLPSSPWFPQKEIIIILSFPIALILAMAASVAAFSLSQRVRTPHDIYSRTNLRFLGSLDSLDSF